jgi:hypothetical protein
MFQEVDVMEDKYGLYIVGIVGVIAIVAIIIMITTGEKERTATLVGDNVGQVAARVTINDCMERGNGWNWNSNLGGCYYYSQFQTDSSHCAARGDHWNWMDGWGCYYVDPRSIVTW